MTKLALSISHSWSSRTSRALVLISVTILSPQLALAQFVQQGPKLVGTGLVARVQQELVSVGLGNSVALSADGNTAIVGGPGDDSNAGAAWVFTRSGNVWRQQGKKLVGAGAKGRATQAYSVALSADGNTAIVGGPYDNPGYYFVFNVDTPGIGAAWVFTRNGNVWKQQDKKLVGTGAVGEQVHQGYSVALSADGNTAIVGGSSDNFDIGAAWVFTRSGNVWSQQGGKLVGTGAVVGRAGFRRVLQGASVALSADGNTAIVGGPGDETMNGAAWAFARKGSVWSQQGSKLVGSTDIRFGSQGGAVALSADGNTAIVGGRTEGVLVFTRNGDVWTQQGGKLVGTGADAGGFKGAGQGTSVALSADGNTVVFGGDRDDSRIGAAWVFTRSGNLWSQQGNKLVGKGAAGASAQGRSVALSADGNTAIVGGPEDSKTGAAWVFVRPKNAN
jgi:hypothetical protein